MYEGECSYGSGGADANPTTNLGQSSSFQNHGMNHVVGVGMCLFCVSPVLLSSQINCACCDPHHHVSERRKMLENLCHHLRLPDIQLPEICSKTSFPFCEKCRSLVETLGKVPIPLQNLNEGLQRCVATIRNKIYQGVLERQSLRMMRMSLEQYAELKALEIQHQIFTLLSDGIVKAYQDNLTKAYKQLEENSTGNGPRGVQPLPSSRNPPQDGLDEEENSVLCYIQKQKPPSKSVVSRRIPLDRNRKPAKERDIIPNRQCFICGRRISGGPSKFLEHKRTHEQTDVSAARKGLVCQWCGCVFSTTHYFKRHLQVKYRCSGFISNSSGVQVEQEQVGGSNQDGCVNYHQCGN